MFNSRIWLAALLTSLCTMQAHALPIESARRGPIVVIGLDGFTFDIIDPLIAEGRLPHLAALIQNGARATLMSEDPMRSPALWTTIATGHSRDVHQIYDFVTGSPFWPKAIRSKEQRLVTSDMRRSPALWEYASSKHAKSLVVGWLNTWPAQPINGLMIAPYVALGEARQTSIKGKIYVEADKQTHPPSAFAKVQTLVEDADAVPPWVIKRLADLPPPKSPLYDKVSHLRRYIYAMKWSLAGARTNTAVLEQALRVRGSLRHQGPYDLVMTYFDGADTLAHRFWVFRQSIAEIEARLRDNGMDPSLAPELKERFGHVLEGYYEFMDKLVGRIVKAAGKRATVLIVSDHGWGSSSGDHELHPNVPFDGEHRLEGVMIAHGPNIARGKRLANQTLYDVAPTVLYMLGQSVPADMPGRVAIDMFDHDFAVSNPPVAKAAPRSLRIPTGGSNAPGINVYFSDVELERLRSLGYVQ